MLSYKTVLVLPGILLQTFQALAITLDPLDPSLLLALLYLRLTPADHSLRLHPLCRCRRRSGPPGPLHEPGWVLPPPLLLVGVWRRLGKYDHILA